MHSYKIYEVICFYFGRTNQSHSTAQIVIGVYFLRADVMPSIYSLTSWLLWQSMQFCKPS